ncbi:hypothetical protein [Catenuloplanes japonicus]|uniref:hypothetical protein n=1 Tax=Catenuloplanes japonicus TaxID=33876 RepID=UPI0005265921|nr:hypothetical protein [Catenuloplanes japonicus]
MVTPDQPPRGRRAPRWVTAAALAAAVAAGTALALPPHGTTGGGTVSAVPAALGLPWPWTPRLAAAPLGAAAVIVGGQSLALEDLQDNASVAVVGPDGDHRLLPLGGPGSAGGTVLLAADGHSLAHDDRNGDLAVTAVDTGDSRTFGVPDGYYAALAFAPDSGRLAVARVTGRTELGLLDLGSGAFLRLGDLPGDYAARPGFWAAFSPSGRHVAFQDGGTVVVAGTDGARSGTFTLPAGAVLAGKGAWTPDGTGLVLGAPTAEGWALSIIDAVTGVARSAPVVLRGTPVGDLLGWSGTGTMVVAGYAGAVDVTSIGLASEVDTVRVLRVPADGGPAEDLLRLPDGVTSVDIAADAMNGEGPARPAPIWPVDRRWAFLALLLVWWPAVGALSACVRRAG